MKGLGAVLAVRRGRSAGRLCVECCRQRSRRAPVSTRADLWLPPRQTGAALNTQQPDLPWQYATLEEVSTVYTPPSLLPGYQCHPCHNLQEDQLFA